MFQFQTSKQQCHNLSKNKQQVCLERCTVFLFLYSGCNINNYISRTWRFHKHLVGDIFTVTEMKQEKEDIRIIHQQLLLLQATRVFGFVFYLDDNCPSFKFRSKHYFLGKNNRSTRISAMEKSDVTHTKMAA